jgi:hypothetical protein
MRPDVLALRRRIGPLADGANTIGKEVFILPKEAFFPERNTYLGRAVREEPVRQSNVLFPTGDHS